MVEPAQPATELQLGQLQCDAAEVCDTVPQADRDEVLRKRMNRLINVDTEVANVLSEEPCAGKPHAGICTGGAQQWAALP